MKAKNRFITMALAACCAFGVSTAGAQMYNLTDLGALPDQKESTPAAINNEGQVAGTSGQSAFRYTMPAKEQMEDVGRHSAKGTHRGFGISGSGVVVGDSSFGMNFTHAAVFMNGSAIDLGTLKQGGTFSRANAINISGQVVGFSSEKQDYMDGRAFIVSTFDRRRMRDLGTLGGAYAQAWSINDFGFVTGNSQLGDKTGAIHAFIWQQEKGMSDLGTLGGDFSYGTFINASNHVVGYSTIKGENNDRIHAFLHNGTEMLDLGSLGGASMDSDRSFALGINANDQVVGYSYLPSDGDVGFGPTPQVVQVAFVWSGKVMLDLNGLIGDAAKNYQLDAAVAINDKGQIAAIAFDKNGGVYHAVLLTPVHNGK